MSRRSMNGSGYCRRRGCGTRKVERMDALGRLVFGCAACERNKKGFCRDCPAPLEKSRGMRCGRCALDRKRKLDREAKARVYATEEGRNRCLKLKRKQYSRPDTRARRLAYERNYRLTHPRPRDEFDRAYHREWHRRNRQNPEYRAQQNARRRELARQRRQLQQVAA